MENVSSLEYQLTPPLYGQVKVTPLALANELNSKLEQWFQNCKFHHLAISGLSNETYDAPLQVEFSYSLRTSLPRDFLKIKSDVTSETDLLNYHQLVKIAHEFIEASHEIYLALTENKQGDNVLSLKNHIDELCSRFHKKNFPDKLDHLEKVLNINSSLEYLRLINRVRNCLEHRSGVVTEQDCDIGKKHISIKWRYPKISTVDGVLSPLSNVNGKQNTSLDFVDQVKTFRMGEKISFDFYDNYKCIYTINLCLKKIEDAIYELMKVEQEKHLVIIRDFTQ
jgi:hypothetical protein